MKSLPNNLKTHSVCIHVYIYVSKLHWTDFGLNGRQLCYKTQLHSKVTLNIYESTEQGPRNNHSFLKIKLFSDIEIYNENYTFNSKEPN